MDLYVNDFDRKTRIFMLGKAIETIKPIGNDLLMKLISPLTQMTIEQLDALAMVFAHYANNDVDTLRNSAGDETTDDADGWIDSKINELKNKKTK